MANRDVRTTEDVLGTEDVRTTDDVRGTADVTTAGGAGGAAVPPEDEEVNPIGSYESWDQTGQSLDAAGAGMTGDSGSIGLTGTGFEDDTDLESVGRGAREEEKEA